MNKNILFAIIVLAISAGWLTYKDYQYDQMVFEYEQELRVQHEYLKACDAVRMYQENLLEKNNIESEVK